MTGPRPTAEAAKALGIDPQLLQRWGRLGIVQPLVTVDDSYWWDVDAVRDQVRKIRDGLQD